MACRLMEILMRLMFSTVALTATLLLASPAVLADAGLGCGPGPMELLTPADCLACVTYVVSCVDDTGIGAETSDCPAAPTSEVISCEIPVGDDAPIEGTCMYDHVTQDLGNETCVTAQDGEHGPCSWSIGDTTYDGVCTDTCTFASADKHHAHAPRRAITWTAVLLGIFMLFFVHRSLHAQASNQD
jgi:hypothetical protein